MNVRMGTPIDLSGERGLVIVTALEANFGNLPLACGTVSDVVLPGRLIGGWVIANTATNAAFGADAVGVAPNTLPNANTFLGSGIYMQTLNPESLGESTIIILTAEASAGVPGIFANVEIGPIQRPRSDGNHVCCAVAFTDHLEITTSLPDLCFKAAAFQPISELQAVGGDIPVIPPNESIAAPGILHVHSCETATEDGGVGAVGAAFDQFLFAIHGQSLGAFGFAVHGKYPLPN
jgi:hypothetical protein